MTTRSSDFHSAILVTVREVWGSAPRDPGAAMLVTAEGIEGTIGGGNLEWRAIEAAREMLATGLAHHELALPLGPALTQCCGGHVSLELRLLDVDEWEALAAIAAGEREQLPLLVLFGAGHVGRALVSAMAPLPCRVRWVDQRAGLFPADPPKNVETCHETDPAAIVPALPAGSFVLVMTHSHPLDLAIVDVALRRADLAWVGLIGSLTKRRRFESQLRARGLGPAALERLVCPIGIRGIDGKEPAVIAAATAAQLLIAFEARARRTQLRKAG